MALQCNTSGLAVDATLRGVGAALLRYSMVEDDLRSGRLVRPVPDVLPLPVNFIRGPQLVRVTVLLTLAYFLHIMAFYFLLKWVPKIVVDMGFTPSSAAGVLVWANVGGATAVRSLSNSCGASTTRRRSGSSCISSWTT